MRLAGRKEYVQNKKTLPDLFYLNGLKKLEVIISYCVVMAIQIKFTLNCANLVDQITG